ncbi:heme NO-binding domain-containing protein [Pseudoalteromonas luteoviolacea]|uniref:heme NO-binding domain-containing protein n=1 Tax=Pseudoalteromonas luteoviolacea TaxID=43657 RepID=UPI001F2A801F|nr:heme NO-binding domain-containing protein [Pseudoalteromonas luteoviolacea]MCF6442783.1 heme NO-binding domain-containing protein [Pseudoalteromonas luteoviolacea]
MKGLIFRCLEELVIEQKGMDLWEQLLEKHCPEDRVYISARSYPDEELLAIATSVSSALNLNMEQTLKAFGTYLFSFLAKKHPAIVKEFKNFDELIMSIDDVIHSEVQKLYEEPNLPTISAKILSKNKIEMIYNSPRQLCFCAEGLIYGCAEHFNESVVIEHTTCTHRSDPVCTLIITHG